MCIHLRVVGGDCCAKDDKHVKTEYCEDCLCKDTKHKGSKCLHAHISDVFCDAGACEIEISIRTFGSRTKFQLSDLVHYSVNNVPECKYDGGYCCSHGHSGQFRYCKKCECENQEHHKTGLQCKGKGGSPKHKGKFCYDGLY